MILGKDNSSNANAQINEPGNQLAGIDLKYHINNTTSIYTQMLGEDEAGYFPSRKIFLYGISRKYYKSASIVKFNLDYYDTESDIKNYVYNHGIYKSGYRYLGSSIGADIDADSNKLKLSSIISRGKDVFKISYIDTDINKNNNPENTLNNISFSSKEIHFSYKRQYGNYSFEIISLFRDTDNKLIANKNAFIRIEYHLN